MYIYIIIITQTEMNKLIRTRYELNNNKFIKNKHKKISKLRCESNDSYQEIAKNRELIKKNIESISKKNKRFYNEIYNMYRYFQHYCWAYIDYNGKFYHVVYYKYAVHNFYDEFCTLYNNYEHLFSYLNSNFSKKLKRNIFVCLMNEYRRKLHEYDNNYIHLNGHTERIYLEKDNR